MTAQEFAVKINTPYPTVAAWLREGKVPGAELKTMGKLKLWLIPGDVLMHFERPVIGRPKKEAKKAAKRKAAQQPALFETAKKGKK